MYILDGRKSAKIPYNVFHMREHIYCRKFGLVLQKHLVTQMMSEFALTSVY
jgi:hypothetical protein